MPSGLTTTSGGCPALQYSSRPVASSSRPTNSVTNMQASLSLHSSALMRLTVSSGGSPKSAERWNPAPARNAKSAAGMPLPEASPIAKWRTPSFSMKS